MPVSGLFFIHSLTFPMLTEQIETVIVGGGQAGLAMSYYLGQLGREHIVLERRRVAERWRSERWDSLFFQAPNWNMRLPGFAHHAADPDAFAPRDEVVRYIEGYASAHRRADTLRRGSNRASSEAGIDAPRDRECERIFHGEECGDRDRAVSETCAYPEPRLQSPAIAFQPVSKSRSLASRRSACRRLRQLGLPNRRGALLWRPARLPVGESPPTHAAPISRQGLYLVESCSRRC